MDLFSPNFNLPSNFLYQDGEVNYYGTIMSSNNANDYFMVLLNQIAWQNDRAHIYGKEIITKRKIAWYGERSFSYNYSNTTKTALPWTNTLLTLKALVEQETGATFNACLLNLYHNGDEGMAWHSDDETALKKRAAIASLSFGAERKFAFKHKQSQATQSLYLQHGSLLVMKGDTQTHWLHRLPPTKTINTPRINLTFRTMV